MQIRKSKEEIIAALKKAGFRITRQRMAIIGFIAGREDHPSARQILDQLKSGEHISFATIYNTLKTLVDLELIKEIDFEHAENRYDTNLTPHLNLVCVRCASIEDIDIELPLSPTEISRKSNFKTMSYRLEFMGLCAKCATGEIIKFDSAPPR
jgi:Fur family peroxide stress response transcriptional regulator